MSQTIVDFYSMLPKNVRRVASRILYSYLSRMDRNAEILFMNYGWANLDPAVNEIPLSDHDEPNRYFIQLYHHACSSIDLREKEVLEVGCGRGGGASYMMRYLNPKTLVGVDITKNAIRFCSKYYKIPGLSFVRDKAESLQFDDNSFDVVVNIESSHCYTSMDQFLKNVYRVLRPDGYFLFADFRPKKHTDTLYRQLENSRLTVVKEERINPYIVRALELVNQRKEKLIKKMMPKILQNILSEFAGVQGTRAYYRFKAGILEYVSLVLRK